MYDQKNTFVSDLLNFHYNHSEINLHLFNYFKNLIIFNYLSNRDKDKKEFDRQLKFKMTSD